MNILMFRIVLIAHLRLLNMKGRFKFRQAAYVGIVYGIPASGPGAVVETLDGKPLDQSALARLRASARDPYPSTLNQ